MSDLYRQLPKVDALLGDPRLADLPHDVAVGAIREVLGDLRRGIGDGTVAEVGDVAARVLERTEVLLHGRLRPVINATGVVVHTNLGRSVWAPQVRQAALQAAGYCNLELDLATGQRGGRMSGVQALLSHLTGAEAALVVNNCAAAVLLSLTALARDREVVVSRGELVEIGGSFRVPDVIASGGARLREVGTTNRTKIADYAAAIGADTAILLRIHPSNYRVVGFTASASREELVALARERGLEMVEDLGSGSLTGRADEPSVRETIAAGVDLVLFSGDKLLGGPQAGLCVGRAATIDKLRAHPLYRALRVDKVILAAVEQTLVLHAKGVPTPTDAMIDAPPALLKARAERLRDALAARGVRATVRVDVGVVGGGALPGHALDSWVVEVPAAAVDAVSRALRVGQPAVVARVADGALVLDVRTVSDDAVDTLAHCVAEIGLSQ